MKKTRKPIQGFKGRIWHEFLMFVGEDGIKAVNVNATDGIKTFNEMVDSGVVIINRKDIDCDDK